MTRKEFVDFQKEFFNKIIATSKEGQKEYTHSDNAFDNFERISEELLIDRKQILWVYLKKHLDGILKYIKTKEDQRDSIHGRITDAIVYLTILSAMFTDEQMDRTYRFYDANSPMI